MTKVIQKVRDFHKDNEGATLVEYAAALAVVLVVGVVALNTLGGTTAGVFGNANTALGGA